MRPSKSKIFRLSEKDSGFTLLELLVVLVIIGLLTTIVGPQVMKMLGNAKGDVARVQLENIGIECKLVHDTDFADGYPSRKLSTWLKQNKKFKNLYIFYTCLQLQ